MSAIAKQEGRGPSRTPSRTGGAERGNRSGGSAAASGERELARVRLVQACEEVDPQALFVSRRERAAASQAAAEAAPEGGARFAAERADRLAGALAERHPALRAALRSATLQVPRLAVVSAAAVCGYAADALGAERYVNLIAFPLLALLAWNLCVYGVLALQPWLRPQGLAAAAALQRALPGLWLRASGFARPAPAATPWLAAALQRFASLWWRSAGGLLALRARLLLHLAALGIAVGVVLGMYVRALGYEYRVSWESTFLEPEQVSALLRIALGPAALLHDALRGASAVRAVELLRPQSVAALRGPAGGGPAATWIHLWAITATAAIAVPRGWLALRAQRRALRLARELVLPLEEPYFLRLLAPGRGEGVRIDVLPYSHQLSPHGRAALQELLLELFGNRAGLCVAEPVPYGDDASQAPLPGASAPAANDHANNHANDHADVHVIVFALAQTPEPEVHGAWLAALRAARPRSALLVLLDEEALRARLGSEAQGRIAERRRAWERVLAAEALGWAPLGGELDDRLLARVRGALAPPAHSPA